MVEDRPTWRPRKGKAPTDLRVADALDAEVPRKKEPWPSQKVRIQAAVAYAMGATDEMVAVLLGKAKSRVQACLGEEKAAAKELLRLKLKGKLYERALEDGDVTSLLFLARSELGMTDRRDLGDLIPGPSNGQPVLVRVEYVLPTDPRALPPPPARLLEARATRIEED